MAGPLALQVSLLILTPVYIKQAVTRAIEAQDKLVEEAKTGIMETALGTNEF